MELKDKQLYYKGKDNDSNKISLYNAEADRIVGNFKSIILENVLLQSSRTNYDFKHDFDCVKTTGGRTEKRLCHCLVNYGKEHEKSCDNCIMKRAYAKPIDNAEFVDFEVAVSSRSDDHIGEIDLIMLYNGEYYAVEFKPNWNNETILRMCAEIVTYYEVANHTPHFKTKYPNCKKGIMFMNNSAQERMFDSDYQHSVGAAMNRIIEESEISVFILDSRNDIYHITKLR